MVKGGRGTNGYFPKSICLLFMLGHIITPSGWHQVTYYLIMDWRVPYKK